MNVVGQVFLTNGFNKLCNNIAVIYLKVGDEFMSETNFQTTLKGGLHLLPYIFRRPELMGA